MQKNERNLLIYQKKIHRHIIMFIMLQMKISIFLLHAQNRSLFQILNLIYFANGGGSNDDKKSIEKYLTLINMQYLSKQKS